MSKLNRLIQPLTSEQNPTFKLALKLKSSRGRKQQNRMVIYGEREFWRAFESGIQFEEIYLTDSGLPELTPERESQLSDSGASCFQLSTKLADKLGFGDRETAIVGVAARPCTNLETFLAPGGSGGFKNIEDCQTLVVLESIEKPGNLGAIVRTVDGAGLDGVLLCQPETDFFHPNAIRASMGCVFRIPVATADGPAARNWLLDHQFVMYATRIGASKRYDQVDFRGRSAIVLGNEAKGLSSSWTCSANDSERKIVSISVPMLGIADSLNVASTAAILCYEARRQRGFQTDLS